MAMAEKISEDLFGRRQGNAMAGSQTETSRDGQSLHRDRAQPGSKGRLMRLTNARLPVVATIRNIDGMERSSMTTST